MVENRSPDLCNRVLFSSELPFFHCKGFNTLPRYDPGFMKHHQIVKSRFSRNFKMSRQRNKIKNIKLECAKGSLPCVGKSYLHTPRGVRASPPVLAGPCLQWGPIKVAVAAQALLGVATHNSDSDYEQEVAWHSPIDMTYDWGLIWYLGLYTPCARVGSQNGGCKK